MQMPYLHFETLRGYKEMAWNTWIARNPPIPPQLGPPPGHHFRGSARPKGLKKAKPPTIGAQLAMVRSKNIPEADDVVSTESDETIERKGSTWKTILHRTEHLRSTLQDLKGKLNSKSVHLPKFIGKSSVDEKNAQKEDLEKGAGKDTVSAFDPNADSVPVAPNESKGLESTTAETEKGFQITKIERQGETESDLKDSSKEKDGEGTKPGPLAAIATVQEQTQEQVNVSVHPATVNQSSTSPPEGAIPGESPIAAKATRQAQHGRENFTAPPRSGTFKGKNKLAHIPEGSQPRTGDPARGAEPALAQRSRPEAAEARMLLGELDQQLIKAYSLPLPHIPGQFPPLQLRRTLDQYFYTHLPSTYERDTDQVVFRYTDKVPGMDPKIFMVDQLWLWVLNGGMQCIF